MRRRMVILFPVISGVIVLFGLLVGTHFLSKNPDSDPSDTTQPGPTQLASIVFPKIDRYPSPANFSSDCTALYWGGVFPSFRNSSPFEIDVRSCDLTGFDLTNREEELMHTTFDSLTVWPALLPENFNPATIMSLGSSSSGLNISRLHEQGITGKNVGIAIIDHTLLVNHTEYARNVQLYEEIHSLEYTASFHGAAVASIAVGDTLGVAPDADLYYLCAWAASRNSSGIVDWDFTYTAQAVERVLEINECLSDDKKIRVISISVGWTPEKRGYQAMEQAVYKAKQKGIFVVSSNLDTSSHYSFYFQGLGRSPLNNPNYSSSYELGWFWKEDFQEDSSMRNWHRERNPLLGPMDSLAAASPTGSSDYVFYRVGGWSWSIPYIAGLYALACQAKNSITPNVFWLKALETGILMTIELNGVIYSVGTIINPVNLIEALSTADRNYNSISH